MARGEKFRAKGNNLAAFMERAAGAIENPPEDDFIVCYILNICSMGNMTLGNLYVYFLYTKILGFTSKHCDILSEKAHHSTPAMVGSMCACHLNFKRAASKLHRFMVDSSTPE